MEFNIGVQRGRFNGGILELFDKHAPCKTARINKRPAPWLTDNLKLMMKIKKKAYLRYKKVRSVSNWNEYKSVRNMVNVSVKTEKKAYLNSKFKSDPKNFWRALKYLNINSNTSDSFEDFSDPSVFNDFFVDSSNLLINNNGNNDSGEYISNKYRDKKCKSLNHEFKFQEISIDSFNETFRLIKSNALGPDNISLDMLNYVLPHLSAYFTHIINYCLVTGTFPKSWKESIIVPLAKKSNP